ncbi:MAG: glutamyl-tRNA synthetase [Solirubrobacteraceae bacterium]|jgi:glutamyl-tRNA synthetase|nr:glutamyl-tRNA synthetase [Solirubrobacteraceae bacterium]
MGYEERRRRAACASWPGSCVPPPSHHGQRIGDGVPPRFEITRPLPRHGAQGRGCRGACSSAAAIGADASSGASARHNARIAATGRYAPSPTGTLHVGNLRTALLAWLFARSQDAAFLVRVDDLDRSRVRPRVAAEQLADLAALGLDWDGPVVRQSERLALYAAAIARLDADGRLYRCYCTRREIREAASAPHGSPPEGAYPGTCRELSGAQRAERERAGRPPALRLRAGGAVVAFRDRLLGARQDAVDDLVVRRNDGAPAYNLAVVVDDAAQGVGEVVRGADLLDTTARQLHLASLLGLPPVRHAHVPLVLGPDGARLAKRHGAVTLADRAAAGQSPIDVRSQLAASVGLCEAGERPTLGELLARFDPAALPSEPSVLTA